MKIRLIILFLFSINLFAQQPDQEGSLVKWMTIAEAMEKEKSNPKPIILDFYTDWCGWCKHMMKTTYADPNLAAYINTYFYPVKFNAEGKDTVDYLGVKYLPLSNEPRTTHPLAAKLLNNQLMYPTTLFLNGYDDAKKEFKMSMIASGYLETNKLEPILIFILENAGRNSSYDDFRDNFKLAFYDSTLSQRQKTITWLNPKEGFSSGVSEKKKSLVFINPSWCNSCKVMKATTFSDTSYVKFLNEHFTLIDFNPDATDTIFFKGQTFTNPKTQQFPFHQLAFALENNALSFPSLIVLDEHQTVVDIIPSYIPPRFFKDIIHFYGENKYKSKSWQEFVKESGGSN
jgi:thioredoxin-related protein